MLPPVEESGAPPAAVDVSGSVPSGPVAARRAEFSDRARSAEPVAGFGFEFTAASSKSRLGSCNTGCAGESAFAFANGQKALAARGTKRYAPVPRAITRIPKANARYEVRFVPRGALSEELGWKEIRGAGSFSQSSEYKNGLPRPFLEYIRA